MLRSGCLGVNSVQAAGTQLIPCGLDPAPRLSIRLSPSPCLSGSRLSSCLALENVSYSFFTLYQLYSTWSSVILLPRLSGCWEQGALPDVSVVGLNVDFSLIPSNPTNYFVLYVVQRGVCNV